jgi:hypothetical protein
MNDLPVIDTVIDMQARLMQDAFYILKLGQYGNAPDNRGWMNLFRRWGRSTTFNARFNEIEETLTAGFVGFYRTYLQECVLSIDAWPIPHPWDAEARRGHPNLPMQVTGVFLDSGIHEVGAPRRSPRVGENPQQAPETGAQAVPPGAGGPRDYEQSSDTGQTPVDPPTT